MIIDFKKIRAYALTKFSKYGMWILSLVGCVRPNNLVKNRFPLSDAPYSISYSQSRKRRNFVHSYDGKLVSVRKRTPQKNDPILWDGHPARP